MSALPGRVLLDTHTLIWLDGSPGLLSDRAAEIVRSPAVELLWSAASSWELTIKVAKGKLTLPRPTVRDYVRDTITALGLVPLAVDHAHVFALENLPRHHHDPFDRLLVTQAIAEGVPLLTRDRALHAYDVETIW